jgi:hypothetical protein
MDAHHTNPYPLDEKKDPENYVDETDSEYNSFTAIIAEGKTKPHHLFLVRNQSAPC